MTPQQFKEHIALLKKIESQLSRLNGVVLPLFNVTNGLGIFLGSENDKGILRDILAELRDE